MVSCQSQPVIKPQTEMEKLEQQFFNDLWNLSPTWAASLGKKEFEGKLRIPDAQSIQDEKAFIGKYMGLFAKINVAGLSESELVDYKLIKNYLESTIWQIDVFKAYQWNPSTYNVGEAFAPIVESKYADEESRHKNLLSLLEKTPAYYAAAFEQLNTPTKEHLHLAIEQNQGTIRYLQNSVKPLLHKSSDQKFQSIYDGAETAIKNYVAKLQDLKAILSKSNGFRSFRIGSKLYKEKFALNLQINATPEEMYTFAKKEKIKTLQEMTKYAKILWSKYFPKTPFLKNNKQAIKKLLYKISEHHADPSTFIEKVREQLPQLRAFVKEKNLLDLDPTKVLTVRETPAYQQGFSTASVDAPGPFDPDRPTYYNVTPLDKMSKERAKSFLREYNNYTMQILNIHEGIPGHYVQLVYSMKSPSLVKKIFGNGTMIEGWAVYSERMMLENGYGNNSPELWLMYYKWYLRVVCNTILDYELHNKNLSQKNALKLLMDDAFQEKTEAEMKWERATYSQVQLASYFSGFSQIYQFRENLKKAQGEKFNLKEFNEHFLSYGSAPIRDIIDLMMVKKK
ncbi:MAG: DUF885 domain-containing protein [Bdellovibrionaceae bacterium]|nr:DUF885 domain-containing protein [Pseudobdellovibrionaceae bacterium]